MALGLINPAHAILTWFQKLTPRLGWGFAAAVLVILLSLGPIKPASAITIIDSDTLSFDTGDVGEMFDVTYFCAARAVCGNQTNTSDTVLSGSTWWMIDSLSSTQAMFTVKIANDTTDGVFMVWAVDIITSSVDGEPFPDSVSITNFDDGMLGGDTTWSADLNQSSSGGFGIVDFCSWAGTNCVGGGNPDNGLVEGGMDTVVLTFSGDFTGTTTFDIFPSKFKSVGTTGISLEPGGTVDITGEPPGGMEMPEPSTLALFGFGLVGLGVMMRRRRRKADAA